MAESKVISGWGSGGARKGVRVEGVACCDGVRLNYVDVCLCGDLRKIGPRTELGLGYVRSEVRLEATYGTSRLKVKMLVLPLTHLIFVCDGRWNKHLTKFKHNISEQSKSVILILLFRQLHLNSYKFLKLERLV